MFTDRERQYVETARVGRLATADSDANPHVVPVCVASAGDTLVSAIDEKPQEVPPETLRRWRDISENPRVALVFDHYREDWDRLGWVQVRGTAALCQPADDAHREGVAALRAKYDQYETHALETRPLIRIAPGSVRSWGDLERPTQNPPAGGEKNGRQNQG
jgi:PPOX class probable F420-dependent enzyme